MKLYEEFKLWENMWEQPLTEDNVVNMVELRRGIKAEIARLAAEKAADTDPTSAVYYDEEIAAYKAELAELERKYPITDAGKKRKQAASEKAALEAEKEKITRELHFRVRCAFARKYSDFGCPKCFALKDGGWQVRAYKPLDKDSITAAEKLCAEYGVPIKYIATEANKTIFEVDTDKLDLTASM